MQVKNTSLRLWTVRDIKIIPGETVDIPDAYRADVENHSELKIVEESVEVKKPGRPAKVKDSEE